MRNDGPARPPDEPDGRRRAIGRYYEPRIAPHRPSHEVLDWASAHSQRARFSVLADNVELAGKSLLDVGCGLGDLWDYLKGRGISVAYTGVDILEKMVQEASRRHGDARFIAADIFDQPPGGPLPEPFEPGEFDVVFCSGALNLNLGNNLQFIRRAIERFFELSRRHVVFNLLHKRARGSDGRYFYYDPDHIASLLAGACRTWRIIDDYLHNDFTVICEKAQPPPDHRPG